MQEAKDGGAHEVLGYKSWTAYLSELLGDEPLRLARDDRQEMVKVLSAEGMSTRAIAPIVGVSFQQVSKDQVSPEATPALPVTLEQKLEAERRSVSTPEHRAAVRDLRPTIGLDGKT